MKRVLRELRAACVALASFFVVVQASVGATYYVATNGNDAADGTSWATAKQTIHAGIDLTVDGDTVLVSNGVYATGGRVVFGVRTNRVAITKAITVRSVNGPGATAIVGAGGSAMVRGVYVGTNATLSGFTVTNGVSLGGSLADRNGGGVWCAAGAVVSNCTLTGNSAINGGGSYGGTLNHCTLTGNSANLGGGSYLGTLNNCTLTGNSVGFYGGGSYTGTLNNCTLTGNSAALYGGGAYGGTLNNCTLTGNSATNWGGGSYLGTLNNCTLTGNSAFNGGGAYGGTLNNCTLTGNSARSGGGWLGGLMYNCTLAGNSARDGGGSYGGLMYNCTLTGNSATNTGGGSYGGIMYNCTLTGNSATNSGGGSYDSTLNNCIVWSNSAPTDANHFLGSRTSNYSCTTPMPINGANNITNDPQFVSLSTTNLQLSAASPCINTGANAYAPTNVTPHDLSGNPRIINGTVDMGAYEFQPYWLWAASITNSLTNYNDSATGDGYANLLKYATGSSPTNSDGLASLGATPLVVGQTVVTNEDFSVTTNDIVGGISLLFSRSTNATDASLYVEEASATTNGTTWTPVATNRLGSWGGGTNVTETGAGTPVSVSVGDLDDATNKFFRLRVTLP